MKSPVHALAVTLALAPLPAQALECLVPSIQREYWWHKSQPETYVLALGRFSGLRLLEEVASREASDGWVQGKTVYRADFAGFSASRRAFDKPFTSEVTLVFPDFSYIGGGYDTASYAERLAGTLGLVWLQKDGSGYQVTADLCSPLVDVDPASIKPALRCLRGGHCPNPD